MTAVQGNGQPIRYTLSISGVVAAALKVLAREATEAGKGAAFVEALERIKDRLHRDPRVFGDPQYHFSEIRLTIYQAVVPPLVVNYAVHEDQPVVLIRWFKRLS